MLLPSLVPNLRISKKNSHIYRRVNVKRPPTLDFRSPKATLRYSKTHWWGTSMDRCSDRRPLSELDPVTFFIVTELMASREQREVPRLTPTSLTEDSEDLLSQVA